MKRLFLLGLALLAPLAQGDASDRWVLATRLLLRAEASPTAAVVGQLEQGSRVRLTTANVGGGDWCMVETHAGLSFAACRYLSERPVVLPRAGEDGVPEDRRWVGGSNLLLRAEPRTDAPVLGRLTLNTVLRQTGENVGNGYCAVQRVDGEPLSGYTACRYLQRTPVELDKLTQPQRPDGSDNPDYDPARAFWITPSWELMAYYARRVAKQRDAQGDAAPKGPDEQLERMKARLSGQVVGATQPAQVWPEWETLRNGPAADVTGVLNLYGAPFEGEAGARLAGGLMRALPALPAVSPSWWRSAAELASPMESVPALASRFGAQVQWLHESLQPGSRNRGSVVPGIRVERLTLPLHRISLLSSAALRDETARPENWEVYWDPTTDTMCEGWVGGFSSGDADAATYRRNGVDKPAAIGPMKLFTFWTSRALPPGPARWTREPFKLARDATGFVAGEWRTVDIDADGIVDLAWLQLTGRGPGHLGDAPAHDDAWLRLLLANVAGRWHLVAVDAFSYGCGC